MEFHSLRLIGDPQINGAALGISYRFRHIK